LLPRHPATNRQLRNESADVIVFFRTRWGRDGYVATGQIPRVPIGQLAMKIWTNVPNQPFFSRRHVF
jgi:hypothetical protein